ncbi:MAG: DNA topoisomerase IV subunit B [Mollicutes bacterium PWAP]|nr:DNA topoisomerase IV subunit B [Mollicutes bacterium PWAP]
MKYSASEIKILKGLDAVRKRPGMYIGSTDVNGLHHLVWEIIDNSIDEVLGGFAKNIKVVLEKDGSVTIEDDGRGIPVDVHKEEGLTAVELVFTELHAGGKFGGENSAYKSSGGLHGVGSSVVNALSNKLEATISRNGKIYKTSFVDGEIKERTHIIGTSKKSGTKIQFWPNYKIFKNSKLNFERIKERVRESSFLISGVNIILLEKETNKKELFSDEKGISSFVKFINENKKNISKVISFKGSYDEIVIDIALQYTDTYTENILSFVNNIKTRDGGSHDSGFKNGLTKAFNEFAKNNKLLKGGFSKLDGSEIREGIVAIISASIPERLLEFVGQTKDKLSTIEAKKITENLTYRKLSSWLIENVEEAKKIVNKLVIARKARLAAKKARDETRKTNKGKTIKKILSGKLTPAQTKIKKDRELYLVEGDSAGGSAKLGRDRKSQAILPLRGKVINSEKAKLSDLIKNEEIGTIISAIGAGIGSEFDIKKVQYGKIIIMTDADTDGAHIQTLLLTFFFRYMKPLFEAGMIYIALPPLYKVSNKKETKYLWEDIELEESLKTMSGISVQRYKGLGEMQAIQLWDTTMNPETRTLIKVNVNDIALIERKVSILMGENTNSRKEWIKDNVVFTLEDDFEV